MKKPLYISRISITNIRCFNSFSISLRPGGKVASWSVFLGDNATGKTTLLRSIAIGLCDQAGAAGLLKEFEEGFVRRGKSNAKINIRLYDPEDPTRLIRIITRLVRVKSSHGEYEVVRQTTIPKRDEFPWDRIFVCGYGAGRGTSGSGDLAGYSPINAMYNMFNYTEGLQNPELTLLRHFNDPKNKVIGMNIEALRIASHISAITLDRRGLLIDGDWGERMPFRDLADGYKSTFLWLSDFLGWGVDFYGEAINPKKIRGIIIIDEIEQHLHPKWKRGLVSSLKSIFPQVQFITSTHSPLVASSIGDFKARKTNDQLTHLVLGEGNSVVKSELPFLKGSDIDQALASEAFDYLITTDSEVETILARASILLGKKKKSAKDQEELNQIKAEIAESYEHFYMEGRSPVEQAVLKEIDADLKKRFGKMFPKN